MRQLIRLLSIACLETRRREGVRDFAALAALLGGLGLSAPLHAGPIIVTGTYALFTQAEDGMGQEYRHVVEGPVTKNLSNSVSLEPLMPPGITASSALTITSTPNQIGVRGSALANTSNFPTPIDEEIYAEVSASITLELTAPYEVDASADFDARNNSSVSFLGPVPDGVYFDPGLGLSYFELRGVLPAGAYSFTAFAGTLSRFPFLEEDGGTSEFGLRINLTPVIPEPSAAIVFPIGIAIVVGARKWLS